MIKRLLLFISALVAVSSQSYGMSEESINPSDTNLILVGNTSDDVYTPAAPL